jgi:hypothetical protein
MRKRRGKKVAAKDIKQKDDIDDDQRSPDGSPGRFEDEKDGDRADPDISPGRRSHPKDEIPIIDGNIEANETAQRGQQKVETQDPPGGGSGSKWVKEKREGQGKAEKNCELA